MMRAFTSDVKMLDRTRVCVLLVLVFICSIDRSSSVAIRCPELAVPSNAVLKRIGDSVMVRCKDTLETWYLSCQGNRWLGEIGNCSHHTAVETERPVLQIIASDELQPVPISHDEHEIRILIDEMKSGRVRRSVTARNSTTDELHFRHPSNLTRQQVKSAVTIEFNFRHFNKTNHAALNATYREVRRKILQYLNRRKSTTASPTNSTTADPNTTIVTTATTPAANAITVTSPTPPPTTTTTVALTFTTVTTPTTTATTIPTTSTTTTAALTTTPTTSTTETSTTVKTTTVFYGEVTLARKRRRRSSGANNDTFTEEDLHFIGNGPEVDNNGNLIITFIIDKEGLDGLDLSDLELSGLDPGKLDLGDLLYKTAIAANESGELGAAAPVVDIYRGLPPVKAAMAGFQVWLPILLAIILLLIIFILAFCCWMAKKKKVKDEDCKKIIPPLDSKPSSSNGQAPKPRILDDNDGRIVPMDQFSEEF